ncbi:hypothetical protein BC939DRAFT_64924 [Gamsiella multidivaricata]|uniref:uncharacterized protein n=1 Tax=Gamsiella multidivaricata TaxID=101098 RepID=UPI00221E8D3A|nr:uncharacterized protein BC939DRAFT_64924 [Gamsiella multidivaricata]KAI7816107.1 hypothetical protein BC939DRAFT_64924 [Gamsiella multidivaricata]
MMSLVMSVAASVLKASKRSLPISSPRKPTHAQAYDRIALSTVFRLLILTRPSMNSVWSFVAITHVLCGTPIRILACRPVWRGEMPIAMHCRPVWRVHPRGQRCDSLIGLLPLGRRSLAPHWRHPSSIEWHTSISTSSAAIELVADNRVKVTGVVGST